MPEIGKIYWFETLSGHHFKGKYIGNNQAISEEYPYGAIFTFKWKEE